MSWQDFCWGFLYLMSLPFVIVLGLAAVTIIVGLALAPFFLVVAFVFWLMDRK